MTPSCFWVAFTLGNLLWVSNSETNNDTAISQFAIFKDEMVPSDIYKVLNFQTLSEKQCSELCLKWAQTRDSTKCRSFEMVGRHTCVLSRMSVMDSRHGYQSLVRAPGTTYYEASKDHLDLYTRIPGVVFRDENKYSQLINNTSAEECAHACSVTPGFGCNSFAYNRDKKVCAVSGDVISSTNDVRKVESYDSFQHSGDWPCDVTLPWGYHPRVISSSRYPFPPQLNQTCIIHLIAPPMKTVVLRIRSLFINSSSCSDTSSGVFIYDGDTDQSETLLSVCLYRKDLVMSSVTSSNRSLTVKISSLTTAVVTKMTYDYADFDPCTDHTCHNGGSCIPQNQAYTCACVSGLTGRMCETNIGNCQSNPCLFGKCIAQVDGYTCVCYKTAVGRWCETYLGECISKPCRNGTCLPLFTGYNCVCDLGFTGKNCEYEINECYSNPCVNGLCIDMVNNYRCVCNNGSSGRKCDVAVNRTKCKGYECKYGTCAINESGSFCQCFPGYTGSECEINVNDCRSLPCGIHGECVDHSDAFRCKCAQGYTGAYCNISLADSCHKNDCIHGYCSVVSPSGSYRCVCESNYTGKNCDTIDTPCLSNPCLYGECTDKGNEFKCKCNLGYIGQRCDMKQLFCTNNFCVNGKCEEGIANYTCRCESGWTGNLCHIKRSPCFYINCNGGKCIETNTGFQCVCDSFHTGKYCDEEKSPCWVHPCGQNGTCIPNGTSFVCLCGQWRTGRLCEYEVKPCHSSPCLNGICLNHEDFYTCVCDDSYTGRNCQNHISSVLLTQTTTETYKQIQTNTPALTADVNLCLNMTCGHGICIPSTDYAYCICSEKYTGLQCNLLIEEETTTKPVPSTTEVPNNLYVNISELCTNISCVNGNCNMISREPACLCNENYTGRLCDILIATDKLDSLSNGLQKRHNESNSCETKVCLHGQCTEISDNASCVCDQDFTGNKCETKLNTIPIDNEKAAAQNHVEVTENPAHTMRACSNTTCINGHCVFKTDHYKCHCHVGYSGKECNISLYPVDLNSIQADENSSRTMEYVAISIVCACLLLFVVAGGILWARKAKRGSLYITNPSDFTVNEQMKRQSSYQINKDIRKSMKEIGPQQRKPKTRCALDLSSGVSESSDDSRHWNNYDDVNINRIDCQSSGGHFVDDPERVRGPPKDRGENMNKTNLDKRDTNQPSVAGRDGHITIRLYDKDYSKSPQFQTVQGVEKGKSDA